MLNQKEELEKKLRDFEPVFWVGPYFEIQDRLYEPDGTLYAICMDTTVLSTERRKVEVHRGDLIILPPAVAIEVTPPARFFGLVYTGPYPYHFRERFIQVWGFEHHPVDSNVKEHSIEDMRHRLFCYWNQKPAQNLHTNFFIRLTLPTIEDQLFSPSVQCFAPNESLVSADFDVSQTIITLGIPLEAYYLTNREAVPQPDLSRTMSPEYKPGN